MPKIRLTISSIDIEVEESEMEHIRKIIATSENQSTECRDGADRLFNYGIRTYFQGILMMPPSIKAEEIGK